MIISYIQRCTDKWTCIAEESSYVTCRPYLYLQQQITLVATCTGEQRLQFSITCVELQYALQDQRHNTLCKIKANFLPCCASIRSLVTELRSSDFSCINYVGV